MAELILSIPGLDKPISEAHDSNGRLVAIDRVAQRMEIWDVAEESKSDLESSPTDILRQLIARMALGYGSFSIWMTVFADDAEMRRRFVDKFPGTAAECFNPDTLAVESPRLQNELDHAGKL